ncbi:Protein-disulfide isomerase-like protein [Maricaulis maris MCS10]|jgi:protein-disulfide isomerase|uniref:Protein-disulfide isomerase-like protein n=1 Tax=Maricaulis maris (strain MCS10) TaxID=394221 RepID=Q0AMJ7_MARMM|nr:thioredoxin domain-containing protein [Maricaulis maris]ABI66490.1 Protein-disulfide isomerase-like protein [Maricaulis maris MCS10]
MSVTRILTSLFLLVAGLALPSIAQAQLAEGAAELRPTDRVIGGADADLLIIEYASFACPHCAHFQTEVWPMIRSEFVETGLIRYSVRPMLTSPPQIAGAGVILSECVPDDRYFDAVDLLFHEQANIFETAREGGDVLAVYNRIAAATGGSAETLLACFQDTAANEHVNAVAVQASEDGIRSTPAFIIAGDLLAIGHPGDGEAGHNHATAGPTVFLHGGEPLMIDGETVPGRLDEDSFRRIILHFLDESDSAD